MPNQCNVQFVDSDEVVDVEELNPLDQNFPGFGDVSISQQITPVSRDAESNALLSDSLFPLIQTDAPVNLPADQGTFQQRQGGEPTDLSYTEEHGQQPSNLESDANTGEIDVFEINDIIAKRYNKDGQLEYLIDWKGFPKAARTYEPYENLNEIAKTFVDNNEIPFRQGKRNETAKKNAK